MGHTKPPAGAGATPSSTVELRSSIVSVDAAPGIDSLPPREPARVSVREWGQKWLDWREREGVRSIRDDRGRWTKHVASEPWAGEPISSISRSIAREWLAVMCAKDLAAQTIQNTLNTVRLCFADAEYQGLIDHNPFFGLKLRKSRAQSSSSEAWTVLRVPEQDAALLSIPIPERWLVAVALGTCLRSGELWSLHLEDVNVTCSDPFLRVRFGKAPREVTKTKASRRTVHLFGIAFSAMQMWLSALPTYAPHNPHGLVFPWCTGQPRQSGNYPAGWRNVSQVVGRHVRFHDLRHSGATSLLAGWWGPSWTLHRLQRFLGHSSVKMTERYAHWLEEDEGQRNAARAMRTARESKPPPRGRKGSTMQNHESVDTGQRRGVKTSTSGAVAKWLGNGLQSRCLSESTAERQGEEGACRFEVCGPAGPGNREPAFVPCALSRDHEGECVPIPCASEAEREREEWAREDERVARERFGELGDVRPNFNGLGEPPWRKSRERFDEINGGASCPETTSSRSSRSFADASFSGSLRGGSSFAGERFDDDGLTARRELAEDDDEDVLRALREALHDEVQ